MVTLHTLQMTTLTATTIIMDITAKITAITVISTVFLVCITGSLVSSVCCSVLKTFPITDFVNSLDLLQFQQIIWPLDAMKPIV